MVTSLAGLAALDVLALVLACETRLTGGNWRGRGAEGYFA